MLFNIINDKIIYIEFKINLLLSLKYKIVERIKMCQIYNYLN